MTDLLSLAEGAVLKATAVIVSLFLGIVIAKLSGKITKHILAQAEINRLLKKSGIKAIDQRVGSMVEWAIYIFTILFILQQLGLTRVVLTILVIASTLIITLSAIIAFRNFIPNAVQGLFIRKELDRHVGKKVEIGSVKGRLKKVGIIQSIIIDGEKHYIPHVYSQKHIKQLQAS